MASREKILVAMSGGVDSAVAALRLKQQGVDVVGAYMKNWINEDNIIGDCPWQQDIEDARAVCDRLGIEFRVVNLMREYRERIVQYLLDGYARGLTPNPDIMCNREIKFGVFRAWAKEHGFDAVATGHYARRVAVPADGGPALGNAPSTAAPEATNRSETAARAAGCISELALSAEGPADPPFMLNRIKGGRARPCARKYRRLGDAPRAAAIENPKSKIETFQLWEGADKNKDQSYFLALLDQEQLRDARFPIGDLTKPELRQLAREAGLPNADKKDSQGICFIGEVKMADFLRAYVPDAAGPIIRATDGRELGRHRGLHFYTLGQRKGIGIPSNTDNEAYVVVGKRAADRALLVAFDHPEAPGLFQREVRVHSLRWIGMPITVGEKLEARVRYRDPRVACEFTPEEGNAALVTFASPQRGLASGQILALYQGERLLGGGVYV